MLTSGSLLARAADFYGWRYSLMHPAYPRHLRGVQLPLAPPLQANCCTFAEAVVVGAAQDADPALAWSLAQHEAMMVLDAARPFSPVDCLVAAGLAELNSPGQVPEPWSVAQLWSRDRSHGHTFLIAGSHAITGRLLILEANCAWGLSGVGWRHFGPLGPEDPAVVPAGWWTRETLPTWSDLSRSYDVRTCRLVREG